MRRPEPTRDETVVDSNRLYAEASNATPAPDALADDVFYFEIVARATDLTVDEVKDRFHNGDAGIVRARMAAKHIAGRAN